MNIFKILASGDGRLTEPNLSAFLGYLLNPKADHGLNDAFLKKIIEPFLQIKSDTNPTNKLFSHSFDSDEEEVYILDLGVNTHFNVEVVLEKALKKEDKGKEIVDIFIKVTKREKKGNEDVSYLFSKNEEPVALILVENKINHDKNVVIQLADQFEASKKYLPEHVISKDEWGKWELKICTILIAPYHENLYAEFNTFKKTQPNAIYLTWEKNNSGEIKSIQNSLLEVLDEQAKGIIPPIPLYTADTLRALINFIINDFSSDADDQQIGGSKTKIFKEFDTLEDAISKGGDSFTKMSIEMKEWLRKLDGEIKNQGLQTNYTRKRISVEINGRKSWSIQFQNNEAFRIHYLNTARKQNDIDGNVNLPKINDFSRHNIKVSEDSLRTVLDNLKFTRENQIV